MNESGRSELHTDRTTDADTAETPVNTGGLQDLRPFADHLMTIAKQLRDGDFAGLTTDGNSPARASTAPDANAPSDSDGPANPRFHYAKSARRIYDTRRRRDAIFGTPELFGEPAWDILLDLYIAFVANKPVSVSSACIGSAAPPTTGLRWLGVLADEGLVVREQDPADQRRVLVRLTHRGLEAMDDYFASAGSAP